MDREILFRGKSADGGEWVYGFYDGRNIVNWVESPADLNDPEKRMLVPSATAIITDTLGEYTGLTDKNGKRIFEGDIVRHKNCYGKVVWDISGYGCYIEAGRTIWNIAFVNDWEVVGNIHDNPELIGGK